MSNELPLYYAIMKHFANDKPDCTEGVMHDLAASYSSYKLFTRKDIDEAPVSYTHLAVNVNTASPGSPTQTSRLALALNWLRLR